MLSDYLKCTVINDEEKQQILTFEWLEVAFHVFHFPINKLPSFIHYPFPPSSYVENHIEKNG